MRKRSGVVISGYYGFNNAGDEAVCAALVQEIRKTLVNVKITVLSADPKKTSSEYGVESIGRNNIFAIFSALRSCKLFISGGGSLLQNATGINSVFFYGAMLSLAKLAGARCMIAAQGLGPLNGKFARYLSRNAINKAEIAAWRDEESLALAKKIGATKPRHKLSCDPVLIWKPFKCKKRDDTAKKTIAFCMRPWKGFAPSAIANVCDCLSRLDYNILLVPFYQGQDDVLCREISDMMLNTPIIAKIDTIKRAQSVYRALCEADIVVAMRLHALIMAEAINLTSIAISYDPKIDAFCKRSGAIIHSTADSINTEKLISDIKAAAEKPVRINTAWQGLWAETTNSIKSLYSNERRDS